MSLDNRLVKLEKPLKVREGLYNKIVIKFIDHDKKVVNTFTIPLNNARLKSK